MDDFNFDTEDDADDFESFDDSFSDSFDDFEEEESAEEGKDNRTFWLVAGILGAILILALVCMVVYAMVILPSRGENQAATAAAINTQNASVEMTAKAEAESRAWTSTPTLTSTSAPVTPTASNTPVVQPTDTPTGPTVTVDPRTATVSALLTQQAGGGVGVTPSPTGLPDSGFADNVGIPGMLALAAALVVVIFLARRLRTTS
jgi:predicted lipid-binding transport protein (Tim44 family)